MDRISKANSEASLPPSLSAMRVNGLWWVESKFLYEFVTLKLENAGTGRHNRAFDGSHQSNFN
jgi:hypothetical protein